MRPCVWLVRKKPNALFGRSDARRGRLLSVASAEPNIDVFQNRPMPALA